MAIVTLPLRQDALVFDFFVTLSSPTVITDNIVRNYYFRFYFNQNNLLWHFDLETEARTPIVTGVPVVLGVDLLSRANGPDAPPGTLVAVDLSNKHLEAGPTDLDVRVKLFYDDGLPDAQ